MKENWKPGTLIYPLPAVLVSCGATPDEYNLLTVAWTGTVCTNPPMCYISVRPERHSYDIIRRTGEFVINLTTEELARATDWCGVRSGRDHDKFRETGLTPVPATVVKAPVVAEAPLSIECRVRQILPLGSHDLFLAEVVNIQADSRYIDSETGKLELQKARPIVYSHGEYFALGRMLGYFGWSVRRKKRIKRERQPDKMKKEPLRTENFRPLPISVQPETPIFFPTRLRPTPARGIRPKSCRKRSAKAVSPTYRRSKARGSALRAEPCGPFLSS